MIVFFAMTVTAACLLSVYAVSHAAAMVIGAVIMAVIVADSRACARRAKKKPGR